METDIDVSLKNSKDSGSLISSALFDLSPKRPPTYADGTVPKVVR